jgi:mycofactocin precursor
MESRAATPTPVSSPGFGHSTRPLESSVRGTTPVAPLRGGKLDLRSMPAPVKLAESRLEDLTIDGICGVY